MSKITSSITNKNLSGQQYKSVEIPDESGYEEPSIDFVSIDANRIKRGLPPLDDSLKLEMLQSQKQSARKGFVSSTKEDDITVESLAEIEKKIQDARRDKANGTSRLSPTAKSRIEALLETSRAQKDVEIDGNKYTLRSLKGKEQRIAIVAAAEFDGSAHAAFEIRRQLLGRALVAINDTDLELYLGTNSIEAKLEAIEDFDEPMLIKLYSEYLNMVQETQTRYFVKTEEDAKEVIEDLKK